MRARIPGRPLRLRQLLGRLFALSGVVIAAAAVAGALSYHNLLNDRSALLGRIDPADRLAAQLLTDYLDQDAGLQGFALTGGTGYLTQYRQAVAAVASMQARLSVILGPASRAGQLAGAVAQEGGRWRTGFAEPTMAALSSGDRSAASTAALFRGQDGFDALRAAIGSLQKQLASERHTAERRLSAASTQLVVVMVVSVAVVLADGIVIWLALRRLVLRPLGAVATDARAVAEGDLGHEVLAAGPADVAALAADIEGMRWRLFAEMSSVQEARARLAEANEELKRSNEDLEQFAYVASHDLQEPLRKVASFCQLLEQRYGDQLDERGAQYIAFAVDGAKRMQVLINDLLAFSRIGRTSERFTEVDLGECLDLCLRNLAGAIEQAGATVETDGHLPTVLGDRTLLVALLQNLVGNAIKFRGDDPPRVVVAATEHEDEPAEGAEGDPGEGRRPGWLISVSDNGIGIEPRFAERIFVIFQRLHGRDSYTGTGIGLAMCRKIVEFHGGHIWLDTGYTGGTRFCFTLPPLPAEESDPAQESDLEHDTADQPG